jgi:GNAT superfamily N-acetyltransferase
MWWRATSAEYTVLRGQGLRDRMRALVEAGREPGLLAYRDREPVGWVSVAPRTDYPRLERSPKLRPVDDTPVWSIVCFYVAAGHRRDGVGTALLAAAERHARARGAQVVEGYPIDTSGGRRDGASLFTGVLDTFEKAGFVEIARRGGRPIVRKQPRPPRRADRR